MYWITSRTFSAQGEDGRFLFIIEKIETGPTSFHKPPRNETKIKYVLNDGSEVNKISGRSYQVAQTGETLIPIS